MKLIPLTQGKFAKVSDEDYEYCMRFKWSVSKGRYTWYAVRGLYVGENKTLSSKMHREIMLLKFGDQHQVDHINKNGLDNRRENLRVCTRSQNLMNQKNRKGKSSSLFKGVSFNKNAKKWSARIKEKHIGYFNTEKEAALAYDNTAQVLFGEFARLNF